MHIEYFHTKQVFSDVSVTIAINKFVWKVFKLQEIK